MNNMDRNVWDRHAVCWFYCEMMDHSATIPCCTCSQLKGENYGICRVADGTGKTPESCGYYVPAGVVRPEVEKAREKAVKSALERYYRRKEIAGDEGYRMGKATEGTEASNQPDMHGSDRAESQDG